MALAHVMFQKHLVGDGWWIGQYADTDIVSRPSRGKYFVFLPLEHSKLFVDANGERSSGTMMPGDRWLFKTQAQAEEALAKYLLCQGRG